MQCAAVRTVGLKYKKNSDSVKKYLKLDFICLNKVKLLLMLQIDTECTCTNYGGDRTPLSSDTH